jgi:hypothetical protein
VSESQACGGGLADRGSERKLGHQGGGRRLPGGGIFCGLMRAVRTDLRGPAENPDL